MIFRIVNSYVYACMRSCVLLKAVVRSHHLWQTLVLMYCTVHRCLYLCHSQITMRTVIDVVFSFVLCLYYVCIRLMLVTCAISVFVIAVLSVVNKRILLLLLLLLLLSISVCLHGHVPSRPRMCMAAICFRTLQPSAAAVAKENKIM